MKLIVFVALSLFVTTAFARSAVEYFKGDVVVTDGMGKRLKTYESLMKTEYQKSKNKIVTTTRRSLYVEGETPEEGQSVMSKDKNGEWIEFGEAGGIKFAGTAELKGPEWAWTEISLKRKNEDGSSNRIVTKFSPPNATMKVEFFDKAGNKLAHALEGKYKLISEAEYNKAVGNLKVKVEKAPGK